ncbi:MAG: hypothetical protein EZS26_002189 [Candidatus Ordinivivax streblomastigis]|uniref:Methyltransferase type 11 domain-containing protein n=1 Tax=Candidatus Ordinivivax streblomastigis TaxID=2540710 RepID=A0A5M8NZZ8_9BACT|nr:MAG: hypothetical protein EZS26_002189 [Candidatus Ordinivivax streblomastigis]
MNSIKTIKSANDFAKDYDRYVQNYQWIGTDVLFGLMYEYIQSNQVLLDIGIGTGLSSELFKKAGLTIYGVDGAIGMIEVCKEKGIASKFCIADLIQDKAWFENETVDHAVSHGVFHLIGDLMPIFKQTAVILKENGCFGFTYESIRNDMDSYTKSAIEGICKKQNLQSGIMVFRHSEEYITKILAMNGFSILKKIEFTAFTDERNRTKTYFTGIIVRKQKH